jgi:hypothetical protein
MTKKMKVRVQTSKGQESISVSPNVKTLSFSSEIEDIDLSSLPPFNQIRKLDLRGNPLQSIDLSPLSHWSNLHTINLFKTQLQSIDLTPLSNCSSLDTISLSGNQINSIDLSPLSACENLGTIDLANNQLQSIDLSPLSKCFNLRYLDLDWNALESIDLAPLAHCHNLWDIDLSYNSPLKQVDVTPIIFTPALQRVFVNESIQITSWVEDPYIRDWSPLRVDSTVGEVEARLSIDPPAPAGSWELLYRIAHITDSPSMPIQVYLLRSLGLESFGFLDGDILKLLRTIPPKTPMESAVKIVKTALIELISHQIDQGGTTIGLDVEGLKEIGEIARRIDKIAELRDAEMKKARVLDSHPLYLDPLWLTAYGYSLLRSLGMNEAPERHETDEVKAAFREIGFDLSLEYVDWDTFWEKVKESPVSEELKKYIFDLVKIALREENPYQ